MLVYPAIDLYSRGNRKQPWDKTTTYQYHEGQYYNFREQPELIETSLEDFIEYSDKPAVQTFYSLLKWLNGDLSALESTDCMFSGSPHPNDAAIVFHCTHLSSGRLEFFIRNLEYNKEERAIGWVLCKLSLYLQIERPDFRKGTFSIVPLVTEYLSAGGDEISGYRICVYFEAYGNGIDDTWLSLNIMFNGIMEALKRMNAEMFSSKTIPL
ncbi:hypothetical protein DOE63_11970 [Salmonella enterica subsp. diarizonae serovar 59:z10:-]|nr:hypothetical protein DOE63_11970 [Salmonella enterica subsp. diarizonae serovar 59:z10:-]